ncbi:MAG: flavodoxin reductase [Bacteroidetes bacterium]|nr:flavodoxin reductase [Bacteroidota bacterium]
MNQFEVKVISVMHLTHDVLKVVTEKPENYEFMPGQATELSINRNGWKKVKRPFTFTCLPGNYFLEFTIKIYPSHRGVTNQFRLIQQDDVLILRDVFGTLMYEGEGVFIAGGAGVTPFISILRSLQSTNSLGGNKLIFANKTKNDIILNREFREMLGENFINILSDEVVQGCSYGHISEDFLREHIPGNVRHIYLCGPPQMMDEVEEQLSAMNIAQETIIKENFAEVPVGKK